MRDEPALRLSFRTLEADSLVVRCLSRLKLLPPAPDNTEEGVPRDLIEVRLNFRVKLMLQTQRER